MPLLIYSPYSGREVKIRDQDIGRAVRDEENRIFYVLEKADGSGYYSAPTRAGNPKEEQRYEEMIAKIAATRASGQLNSQRQIHDATGRRRVGPMSRIAIAIIALAVAGGAYLYYSGQLNHLIQPSNSPATPASVTAPDHTTVPLPSSNGTTPTQAVPPAP